MNMANPKFTKCSTLGGVTVFFKDKNMDRESFDCRICYEIVDDPVTCGRKEGCAAFYCNSCLTTAMEKDKNCPKCRYSITGQATKSLYIKNQLIKQEVYCPNGNGQTDSKAVTGRKRKADALDSCVCQWVGKFSTLLDSHLSKVCPGVMVKCENENSGCKDVFKRGQLDKHKKECLYQILTCEHCDEEITRMAM